MNLEWTQAFLNQIKVQYPDHEHIAVWDGFALQQTILKVHLSININQKWYLPGVYPEFGISLFHAV